MASSREMLDRLWRWKKSSTVLKLTLLTKNEEPEGFIGEITGISEEFMQVGFCGRKKQETLSLDLRGAKFVLGKTTLEAIRSAEVRLLLEELRVDKIHTPVQ